MRSQPAIALLSNGSYTVMITAACAGYSTWRDLDITRWREDATTDGWGSYLFLRDVASGRLWSATYQPTAVEPDDFEVAFAEDRARFTRRDGALTIHQIAERMGKRCRVLPPWLPAKAISKPMRIRIGKAISEIRSALVMRYTSFLQLPNK